MSTLSLIVSLVSLVLATAMAIVVARMRREEQQRSAARVAALSRMSAADFLSEAEPTTTAGPAGLASADLHDTGSLFATPATEASWGPRLTIAAAIVATLAVAGSIAASRGSDRVTAAPDGSSVPLELVALTHQGDGPVLTVSGRVRNPAGAPAITSPTVTVFVFGPDGAFLTSGRALLDMPTLAAGAESAFAVSIPVNGTVARYRVSFRDSGNHPVAHRDRRAGAPLARNE